MFLLHACNWPSGNVDYRGGGKLENQWKGFNRHLLWKDSYGLSLIRSGLGKKNHGKIHFKSMNHILALHLPSSKLMCHIVALPLSLPQDSNSRAL